LEDANYMYVIDGTSVADHNAERPGIQQELSRLKPSWNTAPRPDAGGHNRKTPIIRPRRAWPPWALQADRDRLNSFHVQCLRKICRVPCAYVSRVPNRSILEQTGEHNLSEDLLERQKKLYNDIAALSEEHPLRRLTCEANSNLPRIWDTNRSRGRPKQQWAPSVYAALP